MSLTTDQRAAIDEWVAEHEDDLVSFLQDIVSIHSATTIGEDEEEVAKRILEEMEDLGYDEAFIDDFGNVHGIVEGESDEGVMFNSHIDTVGPSDLDQWDKDPYAAEIEDGLMYGLGTSDMKCAMASMVYGGAAVANLDFTPEHDMWVTGELMEEVREGHSMKYVFEELDVDYRAVVIGEASEMRVKRGHRGRCELKIELDGKSSHASAPERGINPLYHASAILERIEKLNEETEEHEFLGKGTIVGTNLDVQTPSNNAVPAAATVYVDRRLTIGEDEDTVHAELQDAVDSAVDIYGDDVSATIETIDFDTPSWTGYELESRKYMPTWLLEEDHWLVEDTKSVVDDVLQKDTEVTKWTFSTSGNYTMGIAEVPTIGFGPSKEEWAHMANEQVDVDNVVDAASVYAGLGLKL
ncbi:YgeY family selenium metabolism-linked hydrolase [Halodesulfurarchaeum sp.]|uniref:YgeY family selenium metabolism-linked hydrolase n=1 Tax=Halodesulfurarchaeum sp. TaxID=1980530 RepID=UPI002FC33205